MTNSTSQNSKSYQKVAQKQPEQLQVFFIIQTLNGNFLLKESFKEGQYLELEFYAKNLEEAKQFFKGYKNDLKKAGLI